MKNTPKDVTTARQFKIRIYVSKKVNNESGEEFTAYDSKMSNGKWVNVRFTKDVEVRPTENCFIKIREGYCNLNHQPNGVTVLWISKIDEIVAFENKKKFDMADFFEIADDEK